jgi:hypothetical protein
VDEHAKKLFDSMLKGNYADCGEHLWMKKSGGKESGEKKSGSKKSDSSLTKHISQINRVEFDSRVLLFLIIRVMFFLN